MALHLPHANAWTPCFDNRLRTIASYSTTFRALIRMTEYTCIRYLWSLRACSISGHSGIGEKGGVELGRIVQTTCDQANLVDLDVFIVQEGGFNVHALRNGDCIQVQFGHLCNFVLLWDFLCLYSTGNRLASNSCSLGSPSSAEHHRRNKNKDCQHDC